MADTGAAARVVILGVAASDAHVVANRVMALLLEANGFEVVNLGACTAVAEFVEACKQHPEAEAVLIGSLNGHAFEDLRGLEAARRSGAIHCPVVLGGNLSVGSRKSARDRSRLFRRGVDHILTDFLEVVPLLDRLATEHRAVLQDTPA